MPHVDPNLAADLNTAAVVAIVAGTYLVLALGQPPFVRFRVDRTGAAVIGAILMVAVGRLSLDDAWRAIDYRTIIMLFGMMVLVASLRLARFFTVLAREIVGAIRHPLALLVVVIFATGALSALFVNDTICLVFTPVLVELARARGQRPLPYLIGLATASNIGSAAAITGNPQNMLIGSLSHIPYAQFLAALAPVSIFGLAADTAIIALLFRDDFLPAASPAGQAERAVPGALEAASDGARADVMRPIHRAMMWKGALISGGVLAGFLAGLDTALVSACAAAAVLLTRRVKPDKIYQQIDGGLLALFIGLFVVVRGVERAGLDQDLFALLKPIGIQTVWGLSVVATVLSNLTSNVPAVMLFTRLVPHPPDPRQAWLTLAMSSTLAGNLTILGSIANLIVVEGARRHGVQIRFMDYLRVGLPVTLVTLAFGIWWL